LTLIEYRANDLPHLSQHFLIKHHPPTLERATNYIVDPYSSICPSGFGGGIAFHLKVSGWTGFVTQPPNCQ
jgi:hypothetical protein